MKKSPLHIITALLLVTALLTLTGVTSTAATFVDAQAAKSCCDSGCDDPPAKSSGPCSTPDCPCFSCISVMLSAPIKVLRVTTAEPSEYVTAETTLVSGFSRSIDYPPERG